LCFRKHDNLIIYIYTHRSLAPGVKSFTPFFTFPGEQAYSPVFGRCAPKALDFDSVLEAHPFSCIVRKYFVVGRGCRNWGTGDFQYRDQWRVKNEDISSRQLILLLLFMYSYEILFVLMYRKATYLKIIVMEWIMK
jgi:hypothetical protein